MMTDRRPGVCSLAAVTIALACVVPCAAPGAAQQVDSATHTLSTDSLRLTRTVTLEARRLRLRDALTSIAEQADFGLIYGPEVVPVERRITIRLHATSAEEALRKVLAGTGVDFAIASSRQVVLYCRVKPCRSGS